ncbi:MAG TPA: 3-isopropylmalate dehydratase [Thermoanaerobaculia bacterium]|mgnify:CR=1 FL=1|nr:3-isopropylmalate dehydratase [Thermoanaerobaculia bacterium]HUM31305.1 3-isopropylmalate dehydratase [Thermoanaerobaculia bacterium]HXK69659.1 3-isopropylmalate dehydratase [Thermoanaerobaculia bacterium]
MKPTTFEGRAWVIPVDDIDTDMIYHNAHLAVTEISEMGKFALGNLKGWEDFPSRARAGDILIFGQNFGCGSSRQHAVDCFKALGISVILAESFGAIYYRNAVNSGMPVLTTPGLPTGGTISTGETLRVDLEKGELFNITRNCGAGSACPASGVQLDIYHAGDLFDFGRNLSS